MALLFALSMGGLNAWQLTERGIPVSGARIGETRVVVQDCNRDPFTLWQSWSCTVKVPDRHFSSTITMRSVEPVEGELFVEAWTGDGRPRNMILVPPGTKYVKADLMPTDIALIAWLVVVAVVPMVAAVGRGWRRSRQEPNPFAGRTAGSEDQQ